MKQPSLTKPWVYAALSALHKTRCNPDFVYLQIVLVIYTRKLFFSDFYLKKIQEIFFLKQWVCSFMPLINKSLLTNSVHECVIINLTSSSGAQTYTY